MYLQPLGAGQFDILPEQRIGHSGLKVSLRGALRLLQP